MEYPIPGALSTLPQRSQSQRYRGCRWRRLLVSWSCPAPYWSWTPGSGTFSRKKLWPEPQQQTLPAPESEPSGRSLYQPARNQIKKSKSHLFSLFLKNHKACGWKVHISVFFPVPGCIVMQTLILGDRMARVNSVTLIPRRWHTFCAAVVEKIITQNSV